MCKSLSAYQYRCDDRLLNGVEALSWLYTVVLVAFHGFLEKSVNPAFFQRFLSRVSVVLNLAAICYAHIKTYLVGLEKRFALIMGCCTPQELCLTSKLVKGLQGWRALTFAVPLQETGVISIFDFVALGRNRGRHGSMTE